MWNQAQGDSLHSGRVNVRLNSRGFVPSVVRKMAGTIISAPVSADNIILLYTATDDGLLLSAVEAEAGEMIWEKSISMFTTGYWTAGAIVDSTLYCFDAGGLAGLATASGDELMRLPNDKDGWLATSPPTVSGEGIFFHEDAGKLLNVDRKSMDLRWTVWRRGMISYAPPAIADDRLIAQWIRAGKSLVSGIDVATGECCWELEMPELARGVCTLLNGAAYLPLFGQDCILAVDAKTGRGLWRQKVDPRRGRDFPDYVGFCVPNGNLVHCMSPDYCEAIDPLSRKILWRSPIESPVVCAPVADEDSVIVAMENGTIARLSATTGEVIVNCSLGEEVIFTPALTDYGLFLATTDGTLWRIR